MNIRTNILTKAKLNTADLSLIKQSIVRQEQSLRDRMRSENSRANYYSRKQKSILIEAAKSIININKAIKI